MMTAYLNFATIYVHNANAQPDEDPEMAKQILAAN